MLQGISPLHGSENDAPANGPIPGSAGRIDRHPVCPNLPWPNKPRRSRRTRFALQGWSKDLVDERDPMSESICLGIARHSRPRMSCACGSASNHTFPASARGPRNSPDLPSSRKLPGAATEEADEREWDTTCGVPNTWARENPGVEHKLSNIPLDRIRMRDKLSLVIFCDA